MLVETRSLTKRYGDTIALDRCGLAIPAGEVFGLLGPNGAGKSTLLRLLMGFLRPSAGRATIGGLDCYHESVAVHRLVSYLPGDARLFRRMRGSAVLDFFGRLHGGRHRERARQLAERLDLNLSRPVANLSTGMRQKLAIAATIAADTQLLILDEPTANLDPTVRNDIVALVRESQAEGKTVIFSSHVLDEVERACDRVAILRQGTLVHVQQMSTLRRQHRIRAQLTANLPPIPPLLASELKIIAQDGDLTIETPGELSPLLGWLATLPLAEVQIEPIGLSAVYDRFHGAGASVVDSAVIHA